MPDIKSYSKDQLFQIASKKVTPSFLPFADTKTTKPVFFNGETKQMSFYHDDKEGTDFAFDKDSKTVLKYQGDKWVEAAKPSTFDIKYYNKKVDYNAGNALFNKEGIAANLSQNWDNSNPLLNSVMLPVDPFAKLYHNAKKSNTLSTTKAKIVTPGILGGDSEDKDLEVFTSADGKKTYGLDKNTHEVYEKTIGYSGKTGAYASLMGKDSKEERWYKVKDVDSRSLIIAGGDINSKTADGISAKLLDKTNDPYFRNIFGGATDYDAKAIEGRKKIVEQVNSMQSIDSKAFYKGVVDTKVGNTFMTQNPLNIMKAYGIDKMLTTDDNKADFIEYLGVLKYNDDTRTIKGQELVSGETKGRKAFNLVAQNALELSYGLGLSAGHDNIVSQQIEAKRQIYAKELMEGFLAYKGDKQKISVNKAQEYNKENISNAFEKYQKLEGVFKQTQVLKAKYDKAVAAKDYNEANRLGQLINVRNDKMKPFLPSQEEVGDFEEYQKLLEKIGKDTKDAHEIVAKGLPVAYDQAKKDEAAQIQLQLFAALHPQFGGTADLQQLVAGGHHGLVGAIGGIPTSAIHMMSDRSNYSALDAFADNLDDILAHDKEVAFNNDPHKSWHQSAFQSSGYSIGMMLPAIGMTMATGGTSTMAVAASRATQFAGVYTSIFAEYRLKGLDAGLSGEEASSYANVAAMLNSALELFVPVDKVLKGKTWNKAFDISVEDYMKFELGKKGSLAGPAFKRYLGLQLENFIGEGTEEMLQGAADYFHQRIYNGEKLTNFDYDSNLGNLGDVAASVALTNFIMGGIGGLKNPAFTSKNKRHLEAEDYLSRNLDKSIAYLNTLKINQAGGITQEQYNDQIDKLTSNNVLLGMSSGKPLTLFKSLNELASSKQLTQEQVLNLKIKALNYRDVLNGLSKEEVAVFNKLPSISSKMEYLETIILSNPNLKEDNLSKAHQVKFDDKLRTILEESKNKTPEQMVAHMEHVKEFVAQNAVYFDTISEYLGKSFYTTDEKTKEPVFKYGAFLSAIDKHLEATYGIKNKEIVITPKIEDPTPIVETSETPVPREKGVPRTTEQFVEDLQKQFPTEKELHAALSSTDKKRVLLADEDESLLDDEDLVDERKKAMVELASKLHREKQAGPTPIEVPQPEVIDELAAKKAAIEKRKEEKIAELDKSQGYESQSDQKERIDIQTEYLEELAALEGKKPTSPIASGEVNPVATSSGTLLHLEVEDGEEIPWMDLFQLNHSAQGRPVTLLKRVKNKSGVGEVYYELSVVDGKLHVSKTPFVIPVGDRLHSFVNPSRDLGEKENLSNTDGNIFEEAELYVTNYTDTERAKVEKELSEFFAETHTPEEIRSAFTFAVSNEVAEMNKQFLGEDVENPILPVKELIGLGFYSMSKDKKEHLFKANGNKIVCLRRNTDKDVFIKIKLPNGNYTMEVQGYKNRYVILENVKGEIKVRKMSFAEMTLSEFKSLFHGYKRGVTQTNLEQMRKKEKNVEGILSKLGVGITSLTDIPGINLIATKSSMESGRYGTTMTLREAVKKFPEIWTTILNGKNALLIRFYNKRGGDYHVTSNKSPKADAPNTPYKYGYFAQVSNGKNGFHYVRLYLRSLIHTGKAQRIPELIASLNKKLKSVPQIEKEANEFGEGNKKKTYNKNVELREQNYKIIVDTANELNDLVYIKHPTHHVSFHHSHTKQTKEAATTWKINLEFWDRNNNTTQYIEVGDINERTSFEELLGKINEQLKKNKLALLTPESFNEHIPEPTGYSFETDESLLDKFTISTEPYVFSTKLFMSFDDSVEKAIPTPIPIAKKEVPPAATSIVNEDYENEIPGGNQPTDDIVDDGLTDEGGNPADYTNGEYDLFDDEGNFIEREEKKETPPQNIAPEIEKEIESAPADVSTIVELEEKLKRLENYVEDNIDSPDVFDVLEEIDKVKIQISELKGGNRVFKLDDGPTGRSITLEELEEIKKTLPKHIKIRWDVAMKKLKSGAIPLGYFIDNCIYLNKTNLTSIAYHEQFHAIFRTVFTEEEIKKYLAYEKANLLAKDKNYFSKANVEDFISTRGYDVTTSEAIDLMIEESLADGNMLFKDGKYKPTKYSLTKLFTDFREFISNIFRNKAIKKLYSNMQKGVYANSTIKPNRFNKIGYPVAYAVLKGWEKELGGDVISKNIVSLVTAKLIKRLSIIRIDEPETSTSSTLLKKREIRKILEEIASKEENAMRAFIAKSTDGMSEEDLEAFKKDKMELMRRVSAIKVRLFNPDNIDTITKEALHNITKFGYKETNELLEIIEAEEGSTVIHGKDIDAKTDEKMSPAMQDFFNSIIYEELDKYGILREKTTDGHTLYNYLLRLNTSLSSTRELFEELFAISKYNREIKAFLDEFTAYTGYTLTTRDSFENYDEATVNANLSTNIHGINFYHDFINTIDKVRTDHVTVYHKYNDEIRVFHSNRENPAEYQFNQWVNNYLNRDINIKSVYNILDKMTNPNAYIDPNNTEELEKVQKVLAEIGIEVELNYLVYSFVPGEDLEDVPKMNLEDLAQLKKAVLNEALYTKNEEFDVSERIKRISKGNAYFNNNLYESSFKDAAGKIRNSYISPNYLYVKVKELVTKFGAIQNWRVETTPTEHNSKKIERVKQYRKNPYFGNNPLFSLFEAEEAAKLFALWGPMIAGDYVNANMEGKQGITFKTTDPKTLLANMLVLFNDISNKEIDGGVITSKYVTQQMESASTLYIQTLPFVSSLYSVKHGFSKLAEDALYKLFQQEVDRINGKYFVNKQNEVVGTPTQGYVNLQDICQNKLFASNSFLNEFLEKRGVLKVERVKSKDGKEDKVVSAKVGEIGQKMEDEIREEIIKHHTKELSNFTSTLINLEIIKKHVIPQDGSVIFLSPYVQASNFKKSENDSSDPLQRMIGLYYINSFLMSTGFNQLLYGDHAIAANPEDAVKRYKGPNAYGTSRTGFNVKVAITSAAKKLNAKFGEIDSDDGQAYIIAKFARLKAYRDGYIKNAAQAEMWEELIRGVKSPSRLEEIEKEFGFSLVDGIKGAKSVGYNEQLYLKMSETILFKNLTSYWDPKAGKDKKGAWVAFPGWGKQHNKREWMEAHEVDMMLAKSANKRVSNSHVFDHTIFEQKNFTIDKDGINDSVLSSVAANSDSFTEIEGKYYRKQVETESHGMGEISFTSQLFQIIQSELPAKYDSLKLKLNTTLAKMKKQRAISYFSQLEREYTDGEGVTHRLIKKWLRNVRESIMKNTPDQLFEEILKESATGDIEYDTNLPQAVKKLMTQYFNGFAKANAPKLPGRSLVLKSGDGVGVMTDTKGNIITRAKFPYVRDKSKVISRALQIHTFENGKASYGEVMMTRGMAGQLGFKIGDEIPIELLKGVGVRIPTQSHHSVIFFKIVDFLPEFMGDTVIAPDEIVNISGADFDVDKLNVLLKAFYRVREKGVEVIKVFGKAVTPEERYREWFDWYKEDDSYVRSRMKELKNGNETYLRAKLKSKELKKEKDGIKSTVYSGVNSVLFDQRKEAYAKLDEEKDENKRSKIFEEIKEYNEVLDKYKPKLQRLKEIREELASLYDVMNEIEDNYYDEIFSEEPAPYTRQDFIDDPELKAAPALANDFIDTIHEMVQIPELAESFETPATMNVIKTTGRKIFKLLGLSTNAWLGNSVNGFLEAYINNMDGKALVGPHALSNVTGMFLERNKVKFKTVNKLGKRVYYGVKIDGINFNKFDHEATNYRENDIDISDEQFDLMEKAIDEAIKTGKVIDKTEAKKWYTLNLKRRINDTTSSYVSAATDNAKELGMRILNHTIDTAGIWGAFNKMGIGQVKLNLLSRSPILASLGEQFLQNHTYLDPNKGKISTTVNKYISEVGKSLDPKLIYELRDANLTTEDLLNAIIYTRILNESTTISQEDFERIAYELAVINVKILHTFSKGILISNNFRKLGKILSTNKQIESDVEVFDGIVEAYDFFIDDPDGDAIFEIKDVLQKDPAIQQSMTTIRNALKLSGKFFIERTDFVNRGVKKFLPSIERYISREQKPVIKHLYYQFLMMKALQSIKNFDIIGKYGNLILSGPGNIINKFKDIKEKYPELKQNKFLRYLYVKEGDIDTLLTTSNITSEMFSSVMIDSFKLLFNSDEKEIQDFATDLVYYLAIKDVFKFQFNTYVKFLPAPIFSDFANATRLLNSKLYKNEDVSEFLGKSEEELQKEFFELVARSHRHSKVLLKAAFDEKGDIYHVYRDGNLGPLLRQFSPDGKKLLSIRKTENGTYVFRGAHGMADKDLGPYSKKFDVSAEFLFPTIRDEKTKLSSFDFPEAMMIDGDTVLIKVSETIKGGIKTTEYKATTLFSNKDMNPVSANTSFYEKLTKQIMQKKEEGNTNDDGYNYNAGLTPVEDYGLENIGSFDFIQEDSIDGEQSWQENEWQSGQDEDGGNPDEYTKEPYIDWSTFDDTQETPKATPETTAPLGSLEVANIVLKYQENEKAKLTSVLTPELQKAIEKIIEEQGGTPKYHSNTMRQIKEYVSNSIHKATIPVKNSGNSDDIYPKLGDKTVSENVIIRTWSELKSAKKAITKEILNPIYGEETVVISTRIFGSNEHFGNPFSHEPAGKTNGLIKTETIKEAVENYILWILYGKGVFANNDGSKNEIVSKLEQFDEQREWIVKQLESQELQGKSILYYTELGEPSHATALDYLINKYDWDSQVIKNENLEVSDKPLFTQYQELGGTELTENGFNSLPLQIQQEIIRQKKEC